MMVQRTPRRDGEALVIDFAEPATIAGVHARGLVRVEFLDATGELISVQRGGRVFPVARDTARIVLHGAIDCTRSVAVAVVPRAHDQLRVLDAPWNEQENQ